MNLSAKFLRFLKDESGPTAVEYAVMLALLLIVMFQVIRGLGEGTNSTFDRTNTGLANVSETAQNAGS